MITMRILRTSEGDEALDKNGKCNEYAIKYLVTGAETKKHALDAVHAEAPDRIGETTSSDAEIMAYNGVRFESFEGDAIGITALYKLEDNPDYDDSNFNDDEPEPMFSFDTSGGSEHIERSAKQARYASPGKAAPDANGFIGWNGKSGPDSEITGIDIVTPNARKSYTRVLRKNQITNAFERTLVRATGKVNLTGFKGWAQGEVLFLGASYSATDDARKIAVTYHFGIRENERNRKIGDITVPFKKGWQAIWQIAETKVKAGEKPSLVIDGVYINEVYTEIDFGVLGIKGK